MRLLYPSLEDYDRAIEIRLARIGGEAANAAERVVAAARSGSRVVQADVAAIWAAAVPAPPALGCARAQERRPEGGRS